MDWDRNYVRKKYGFSDNFQYGIFYPCSNPKRLLVFFSTMGTDRFDRYSWFWREDEDWTETAYLFLKDDAASYFLGTEERHFIPAFSKIITQHMNKLGLEKSNVFTVGVSMGGYAAIYYASHLELNGAIVSGPQLDYESARSSSAPWDRHIRKTGSLWVDLGAFIHKKNIVPNIYLEYGNYFADKSAAEKFFNSYLYNDNGLLVIRRADWHKHAGNNDLSKQTIESVVLFFENHGFGAQRERRT